MSDRRCDRCRLWEPPDELEERWRIAEGRVPEGECHHWRNSGIEENNTFPPDWHCAGFEEGEWRPQ